jgi:hypothetical protein
MYKVIVNKKEKILPAYIVEPTIAESSKVVRYKDGRITVSKDHIKFTARRIDYEQARNL